MNLIEKLLRIGAATIGLVVAPIDAAVEIPLLVKNIKRGNELKEVEAQSKFVSVVSEKLSNELEQLNSTTLNMGEYVVSTAVEDKQKHYEDVYDKAVNELSEFEIYMDISKEEFVNYMVQNGEELERYMYSEKFKSRLIELKAILQDETKSPKEKLYDLQLSVKDNMDFKSQETINNNAVFTICVFFLILQMTALGLSIGFVYPMDEADKKGFLETAAFLLFGPFTTIQIRDIIIDTSDN